MSQDVLTADLDTINFFTEDNLANPYPLLKRLRKERPVAKFRQPGFNRDQYVVTPHALVLEAFRDHERFSNHYLEILTGLGQDEPEIEKLLAETWQEVDTLLTADEPDHTRLRSLAAKGFMPARVKRMSGLIGTVINNLINGFIEKGECDFDADYAASLPVNSVCAALGIPPDRYADLEDWIVARMRRNGQMGSPEQRLADAKKLVAMKHYIKEFVDGRKQHPQNDLTSDLCTARVDGASPFTDEELYSTVMMILVGGGDTSRNTLTSAMARIVASHEVMNPLRADPALIPRAVDEVLRIDSPGAALWRIAKYDTELGGTTIPEGSILMLRMDGANHDETVFPNPEQFSLDRGGDSLPHTSFGSGIHYCIGFRLAREQINQSITALLTRLDNLRIVPEKSDLRAQPSVFVRGLRKLTLQFTPGKSSGTERAA